MGAGTGAEAEAPEAGVERKGSSMNVNFFGEMLTIGDTDDSGAAAGEAEDIVLWFERVEKTMGVAAFLAEGMERGTTRFVMALLSFNTLVRNRVFLTLATELAQESVIDGQGGGGNIKKCMEIKE